MNPIRRGLVAVLAVSCLSTSWGCGEGAKPPVATSTTEATVKGMVKLNGKPATGGEVIFDPANYLRKDATPRKAPIQPDGTYEIKTLTGPNRVSLAGAALKELPQAQFQKLDCDVQASGTTFDIGLPK